MAQYQHPGVFIEEVSLGARPIEGVATSVGAFIGWAKKGPVGTPTLITSWKEFEDTFGGFFTWGNTRSYLAYAVFGFFANGGSRCYVLRITDGNEVTAGVTVVDQATTPVNTLQIDAKNGGAWGNNIVVDIANSNLASTKISGTAANIGDTNITVASTEGIYPGSILEFQTGPEYHVVVAVDRSANVITIDSGLSSAQAIDNTVISQEFDLIVKYNNVTVEEWKYLTMGGAGTSGLEIAPNYVETVVNDDLTGSNYIVTTDLDSASAIPTNRPAVGSSTLTSGSDGTLQPSVTNHSTAIATTQAFNTVDSITLLCDPDIHSCSGSPTDADLQGLQNDLFTYCESRKDCIALVSVKAGANVTDAETWAGALNATSFGALFYPWGEVEDPLNQGKTYVPLMGHIAGLIARTDDSRGVHKAPAGTLAVLRGVRQFQQVVTDTDIDTLLPAKVNSCISLRGIGNVCWGARTLSSDSNYRYIPVRRTLNYIEESISDGLKWAVFEPNDSKLWSKLRLSVQAFLLSTWRTGALQGVKPSEAFYVKCDSTTNPQSEIDLGRVHVEIGVAPVKPAEFVIIQIGLWDGGRLVRELASM